LRSFIFGRSPCSADRFTRTCNKYKIISESRKDVTTSSPLRNAISKRVRKRGKPCR
jgi:hypothetical protein